MADGKNPDVQTNPPVQAAGGTTPAPAHNAVNEGAELLFDLLEPTGLVAVDRLGALRGRVGKGSFAQALRDAGLASDEGVARALAARYHMAFLYISGQESAPEAVTQ